MKSGQWQGTAFYWLKSMKIKNIFFSLFIFVFIIVCAGFGITFFMLRHHVVDFAALDRINEECETIILDQEGHEWMRFAIDKRKPVAFSAIPTSVINAFIATEDWQFFSHHGISYKGIVRSLLVNIYYGRKVQGASTITQQLVKMLFFDGSKTFSRKIKEQLYAILAEMQYTKEQILQTYLNNIYFGCGIYGIQAAAQRFWAKDVRDLSLDEAATLAGIVRRPASYCPLLYPLSAQSRRNVVLGLMKKCEFINEEEYYRARDMQIAMVPCSKEESGEFHAREMIRTFLENNLGKHILYQEGMVVQTTFNKQMQIEASKAFRTHCASLRNSMKKPVDGALISIDRKTGAIRALIGGFDTSASHFNRATQARRQLGSIFKPLIYAAALERGKTFADTDIDEPYELIANNKTWCPRNYNNKFNGEITLAYALSHSNNIVAIKTLLDIGFQPVIALAHKCHLSGPLYAYPSLALGCVDTTPLEAAALFNVFANNGMYVKPHYISWVKDRWGKKIWRHKDEKELVLPSVIADQVAYVLTHGIERIHQYYPQPWIKSQAISKTGTTNDWRTCWFVGSTPEITTALYMGYDDNSSLGVDMYPLRTAFPIWLSYNRAVEKKQCFFEFDPSLCRICINEKTGKVTEPYKPGAIIVLTLPSENA